MQAFGRSAFPLEYCRIYRKLTKKRLFERNGPIRSFSRVYWLGEVANGESMILPMGCHDNMHQPVALEAGRDTCDEGHYFMLSITTTYSWYLTQKSSPNRLYAPVLVYIIFEYHLSVDLERYIIISIKGCKQIRNVYDRVRSIMRTPLGPVTFRSPISSKNSLRKEIQYGIITHINNNAIYSHQFHHISPTAVTHIPRHQNYQLMSSSADGWPSIERERAPDGAWYSI